MCKIQNKKSYQYQITFGVCDIIQLWCISNVDDVIDEMLWCISNADDVIDESRSIVKRKFVETRNEEITYFSSFYGVV